MAYLLLPFCTFFVSLFPWSYTQTDTTLPQYIDIYMLIYGWTHGYLFLNIISFFFPMAFSFDKNVYLVLHMLVFIFWWLSTWLETMTIKLSWIFLLLLHMFILMWFQTEVAPSHGPWRCTHRWTLDGSSCSQSATSQIWRHLVCDPDESGKNMRELAIISGHYFLLLFQWPAYFSWSINTFIIWAAGLLVDFSRSRGPIGAHRSVLPWTMLQWGLIWPCQP